MADLQRKGQVGGPSVVELLRINCDLFHASNAIALVHLRAGGEPDLALLIRGVYFGFGLREINVGNGS
jgi:hypothetical protein